MAYKDRETRLLYSKNWKLKAKQDVIKAYGGKCKCCEDTTFEFLSIDHVENNGREHRRVHKIASGTDTYQWLKKQEYPQEGYQLLCMNCNFSKARYGYCPHQKYGE